MRDAARSYLFSLRRKVREHLLHTLVEIPGVLVCVVGKGVTGSSPPDQILALGVEQIDDESPNLIGFSCCCRITEPTESSPAPTSSKTIVESVERLLIPRNIYRYDADITARIHLG